MRFRPRCGSIPSASTSSCGRPGRARIQHWRQGRARTEIARIASFVGVRTDRQHGCAVEGSTAARDNSVHFTVRAVGAIARLPAGSVDGSGFTQAMEVSCTLVVARAGFGCRVPSRLGSPPSTMMEASSRRDDRSPNLATTAMQERSNDIPSATDLLEVLLSSPTEFELTAEELSALQGIRLDLQSALIDISSSIRKAGLSREEGAGAAQGVDAAIADLIEAAAAASMTANAALRRVLGQGKYRRAVSVFERQVKEAAVATSVSGEPQGKDQKVVEIETAVMVAERLVSWAKLFAWLVAVPAALLIAILTVIGISKFSDFTTLVAESEMKLKTTVALATTNANLFAQKVADLSQKQAEADRQLATLSQELKTVTERLGFDPDSNLTPEARKLLQDQFAKFQAYIVGFGYAPGTAEIKVQILTDGKAGTLAYYQNGTIFVAKEAVKDPEVIYREYLHHVLYSKIGLTNVGPERSALESGLADYLVASYAGTPKIYRLLFGTPLNLEEARTIKPVTGHEDRFPVGYAWASLFFQLRQEVGRDTIDKAVFAAWFDIPKQVADASIPGDMMAKMLAIVAPAPDSPNRAVFVKLARERGAPLPKGVPGR